MCENPASHSHDCSDLGRQDPRGCRFIYGDPGDGPWHYCQRTIVKGGKLGDARRPPYCMRHAKVCAGKSNPFYFERFMRRGQSAHPGDSNILVCFENRGDGQRIPVDTLLKMNSSGVFFHD